MSVVVVVVYVVVGGGGIMGCKGIASNSVGGEGELISMYDMGRGLDMCRLRCPSDGSDVGELSSGKVCLLRLSGSCWFVPSGRTFKR